MKCVATIAGEKYVLVIERPGEVMLNDVARTVHLESIQGDALFVLLVDARSYEVFVERGKDSYFITVDGNRYEVGIEDQRQEVSRAATSPAPEQKEKVRREPELVVATPWSEREEKGGAEAGTGTVTSPLTGVLVEILVEEGQHVKAGDSVAILEAMKMENEVRAPCDGVVKHIRAVAGETLRMDDVIMVIDA